MFTVKRLSKLLFKTIKRFKNISCLRLREEVKRFLEENKKFKNISCLRLR